MATSSSAAQFQLLSSSSSPSKLFSASHSLFFSPFNPTLSCVVNRNARLQFGANGCNFPLMFRLEKCYCCRAYSSDMVIRSNYPQNADLPRYYSKREKKPFPIPIVELRRATLERLKSVQGKPRKPTPPPRNGMLVRNLIPVAYDVVENQHHLQGSC